VWGAARRKPTGEVKIVRVPSSDVTASPVTQSRRSATIHLSAPERDHVGDARRTAIGARVGRLVAGGEGKLFRQPDPHHNSWTGNRG
jgi:hypothetical protein